MTQPDAAPREVAERPLVRFTETGVPWVDPVELLLSRVGQAALAQLLGGHHG